MRGHIGRPGAVIASVLIVAGLLGGCGGSGGGSTTTSAAQLSAAKKEGEEAARERDRVAGLQRQVHRIKRMMRHNHASASRQAPSTATAASSPSTLSTEAEPVSFHAPSGNVSCEVFVEGATCTVASVGETFVLDPGEPATIEAEAALPADYGEAVGYGSTVAGGGSVTCEVPPSDSPRGISCVDSSDGHGFEASRVPDRQKAY